MSKDFQYAAGQRVAITVSQDKQIRKMYEGILENIKREVKTLEGKTNVSSKIRKDYLKNLSKQIKAEIKKIDAELEEQVKKNMIKVSRSVVKENKEILTKMGFDLKNSIAFSNVPDDIVREITSGKLYKGRWNLSSAIWGNSKKTLKDIDFIIAKGIAENRNVYDIAKDLESYVDPAVAKQWAWSKVYPGTNKKIDYNAQRMARTMISHSYEESFVRVTKNNPFFESYRWLISNSDRVCPICIGRAEDDNYGLGAGLYPKDALPLDHPNGMCTFETVRTKSYDEIVDDLVNWANGTGSKKLNDSISSFAEELMK